MKKYKYIILITTIAFFLQSCSDFLEKAPLGRETDQNFLKDPNNAILAVNAAYDVLQYDEGSDGQGNYLPHNYEWMWGDVLSDDAEKGSTPSDFIAIQELKEWRATASNGPASGLWGNLWVGVFRSNFVLQNIDNSGLPATVLNRVKGEAKFLRAYFYFYLVRVYGGVPLFTKGISPDQYTTSKRASVSETYAFIEADLKDAIALLPEKNGYSATDIGRATKGAARGYLARAIMYQIGTDNKNGHKWDEVYSLTADVMKSGQYTLANNYSEIFETTGENNVESVFEVQASEVSSVGWGGDSKKTGVTNNIIQNNRATWGWGFNNPTKSLIAEYEPNDPRREATVYGNDEVVLGIKQTIKYPEQNATGYLNRKAALLKPVETKAAGQNIRKMRYADILLMNAEAAANIGKSSEAVAILNQIRERARKATKPLGTVEGAALTYEPANVPSTALPAISASLTGKPLMDAIWHERRVELGMEQLRFWDLVRTGRYLNTLDSKVRAACQSHSIPGTANAIPVLPIPINEVQSWGIEQNPAYN
jgi:starch-binding outer membrane protein, SusD/RagB family